MSLARSPRTLYPQTACSILGPPLRRGRIATARRLLSKHESPLLLIIRIPARLRQNRRKIAFGTHRKPTTQTRMRRRLFPYKEVVYEKERKEYHHSFDAFSKKTKVGKLLRASKSSSSSSLWWSCDAIRRVMMRAKERVVFVVFGVLVFKLEF